MGWWMVLWWLVAIVVLVLLVRLYVVDQQFTIKKAGQELHRYRRKGAGPTTRLLIDGISRACVAGGSLLDIGAGVGALTFELLERGFDRAVIVEASAGYTAAASSEAVRRGRSPQVEFVSGDFLEVARTVSKASVVALDRVVCCYPLYEELLTEAIRRAERAFAFSYPRELWYVRAGMKLENALRSRKTGFRTFVHPEAKMRELIRRAGFDLVFQRRTAVWSADVFVRQA
jgi:magnesium-protoporphyrin O-methyltransferase